MYPPACHVEIPEIVPGSETPPIKLPTDKAERPKAIDAIYPELPPLPEAPTPLPGPSGRPYTLEDLQQMAATNSPLLRQAAEQFLLRLLPGADIQVAVQFSQSGL